LLNHRARRVYCFLLGRIHAAAAFASALIHGKISSGGIPSDRGGPILLSEIKPRSFSSNGPSAITWANVGCFCGHRCKGPLPSNYKGIRKYSSATRYFVAGLPKESENPVFRIGLCPNLVLEPVRRDFRHTDFAGSEGSAV
jgi:hypothetical protein